MKDILLFIVPTILSSVITWFLSRRKYKAESQANEIDNVEKVLSIYRGTIEDFKKEIDELREKINLVVKENEALGIQMHALTHELACTRSENKRLITELKKYNAKTTEDAA